MTRLLPGEIHEPKPDTVRRVRRAVAELALGRLGEGEDRPPLGPVIAHGPSPFCVPQAAKAEEILEDRRQLGKLALVP